MTTQTEAQYNAAKKKAAKKKKPAASAKKQKPTAAKQTKTDPKVLAAAKKLLPAIRSGEITLRSLWRDKLKLDSIAPLRRVLTELCGGNAQYLAMLDARAKARAKKKAATGKG